MPITKELKERWIARLESPEAKWAGGTLIDEETGGMCCLGHLAFIEGHLGEDGNIKHPDMSGEDYVSGGIAAYTRVTRNAFGRRRISRVTLYGLDTKVQGDLARLNDEREAFPIKEIRALPTVD